MNEFRNIQAGAHALSDESFLIEKAALVASLFFLAFGVGLLVDGKKLYSRQLRDSLKVDFTATLNPYQ